MKSIRKHQNLPVNWEERELLREKGQFWTPSWIAEAMMSYVVENAEEVLDPATGNGSFFRAFLKSGSDKTFQGFDVDPEILKENIYANSLCNVEIRDYLKNPPQKKYSAIIANPPYIRHHRIDSTTKSYLKNLCKKITGFTIDGRSGYHIYFLLQALYQLKKNGKLAFIIPSDTCEGKFSTSLWNWIAEHYNIECVVTFEEDATPFPSVDTNAIILLIKNSPPQQSFSWVIVKEAYNYDLQSFITQKFESTQKFDTLEIYSRSLSEALTTGLSRKPNNTVFRYKLIDLAKVMRGVATGANDFFFLTEKQVSNYNLPMEFLKIAIGRTGDLDKEIIDKKTFDNLRIKERPIYLFSPDNRDIECFPDSVIKYLRIGEELGLPQKSLISTRKPWYKMEKRNSPPILFTYLGRRNVRFVRNLYNAIPLTSFLCVYPLKDREEYIERLFALLNEPEVIENLKLVAKSYGSGALKVEPGQLQNLPIPERLIHKYNFTDFACQKQEQLTWF